MTDQSNELLKPLYDKEIEELRDILDSFGEKAMSLEMLNGFLTAINCCPEEIPPSSYVRIICGMERESESPFENEEQFSVFFELLMRYLSSIRDCLQDEVYEPFIEDVPEIGAKWALGFLQGIFFAEKDFKSMMSDEDGRMASALLFVLAFGNDESFKDLPILSGEEITREKRKQLIKGLPFSVMLIYSHFHGFDGVSRPIRKNKIGRNDPCPCGSGKKYKKCCIASGVK